MQVYDGVLVFTGFFGDVNVPDVQVRQANIRIMNFSNESRKSGYDFLFLLLLETAPVPRDKIGQALGLQFFGYKEGAVLDAVCNIFAEAYGMISFDTAIEKQPGVFPFVPGLGARPADVAPTEYHVFEMRMRKTLHEKLLFIRIRAEAELYDVSFPVYADSFCRQVLEKIFERFEIEFGKKIRP